MKKALILILISFFPLSLLPQVTDYARRQVEILTSPGFYGRGYVKKGDHIASEYISQQFKTFGLEHFSKSYFQDYDFPVNTFPSDILVQVENVVLEPGVDYLVGATSGSCKGTYPVAWINKKVVDFPDAFRNMLSNDLKNYFIAIDTTGIKDKDYLNLIEMIRKENPVKARGIVEIQHGNLVHRIRKTALGYPVIEIRNGKLTPDNKNITVNIRNKFIKKYKTRNVIGFIKGRVDTFVVFTAHYDHLGMLGKKTMFPGANDNASGTAMVLSLARYFSASVEKPHYSVAFMLFSGEEAGLMGSKYYASNPLFPLEKIKVLFNTDLVGTGEDGINVAEGTVLKKEFNRLDSINSLKKYFVKVNASAPAANSDQSPFYDKGVKALFILTLGNYKEYHNIYDKAEGLPLSRFDELFSLLRDYAELKN